MKTPLILFLSLALAGAAFAQMVPVTTTIRTPYGNVPHTYYVGSPRMHNFSGQVNASLKYKFTIVLKNDSTITVRTRIDHSGATHTLSVKHKDRFEQMISPADTKEIFRYDVENRKISGIPADSCWLFKTKPGKINCYSFLSEMGMAYVIAIQLGDDGPIVPLTKENLIPMVGNDPKLLKYIEKGKLRKAVETFNK